MTRIATNAEISGIRLSDQMNDPGNPSPGYRVLFAKSDGLYTRDSSGVVLGPFGSGSGGSPVILSGAWADKGAPGTNGKVYFPTDAPVIARDNGAVWGSWGPVYAFTPPPPLNTFSWVNQGSTTVLENASGINLTVASSYNNSLRALVKSAPATPYKITGFFLTVGVADNYNGAGLCWRDSVSGKMAALSHRTDNRIHFTRWTNATTMGSDYYAFLTQVRPLFLRIEDNGVNRIGSISVDGVNFITVYSGLRSEHAVMDQVGLFINGYSSVTPITTTLVSWKEE